MKKEVFLTEPLEYCGERYESLTLDFDRLTGQADLAARLAILKMTGIVILRPETSDPYLTLMAANAAGVDQDVVDALDADSYCAVMDAVADYISDSHVDGDVLVLKTPVTEKKGEEEREISSLLFRFDQLKGVDILTASRQLGASTGLVDRRENNVPLLSALAAKAAGVSKSVMGKLAACDHAAAVSAARSFFVSTSLKRKSRELKRKTAQNDSADGSADNP